VSAVLSLHHFFLFFFSLATFQDAAQPAKPPKRPPKPRESLKTTPKKQTKLKHHKKNWFFDSTGFVSLPAVLDTDKTATLKRYLDAQFMSCRQRSHASSTVEEDFKLKIGHRELETLIGAPALEKIAAVFPRRKWDEIKLRRCCAHGKHINFHTDVAKETMQIPLTSDSTYQASSFVDFCLLALLALLLSSVLSFRIFSLAVISAQLLGFSWVSFRFLRFDMPDVVL
jgi:hypothetical protein